MLEFFKSIFSEKPLFKGLELIDESTFTDEERHNNKLKILKLYEPFKVAQRLIAFAVCIPFILIHLIVFCFWLYSVFFIGSGVEYKFIYEQLKLIEDYNNAALEEPFTYIVIFYYLGGAIEGAARRFKRHQT